VSRLVEGAFGIAAAVLLVVIARMRLTDADRDTGAAEPRAARPVPGLGTARPEAGLGTPQPVPGLGTPRPGI
jgi:hypothetical protein